MTLLELIQWMNKYSNIQFTIFKSHEEIIKGAIVCKVIVVINNKSYHHNFIITQKEFIYGVVDNSMLGYHIGKMVNEIDRTIK